ncbi:MAG: tripartite tricarboxylate transporter TctB family protein [Geminicoccaceae bacterium]
MSETRESPISFEGEDAGAGYASPALDLIASAFLVVLSIVIMAASLTLPVPGDLTTAPGLLPFLVAASLLLMALGLAITTVRRRRGEVGSILDGRDRETDRNTLQLAAAVAIYIAALQFLAFRHDIVIAGFRHTISAFEPVTIVALVAIIHVAWRGPLWITTLISIIWAWALSLVFQHVFVIPLPGGF